MISRELKINGMSCQHCIMRLNEELSKLQNLIVKEVNIGKATVEYESGNVTHQEMEEAVNKAGYKLISKL